MSSIQKTAKCCTISHNVKVNNFKMLKMANEKQHFLSKFTLKLHVSGLPAAVVLLFQRAFKRRLLIGELQGKYEFTWVVMS